MSATEPWMGINGRIAFRWSEPGDPQQLPSNSKGWAHHGIALTSTGDVVTFAPDRPEVRISSPDGELRRVWEAPVSTGHGLTIATTEGNESLWIADNGDSLLPQPDGSYASAHDAGERFHGSVVQMSLDGEEIRRLPVPPHLAYAAGKFCPTDVAVNETQYGGDGHVWVADGYGESLVHEFDQHGVWLQTLTGETGLGRFLEPHAVFIDRRKEVPELYIADRGHSRIQVFGLDGSFLRGVGVGKLISPGGFARFGTGLLVAELDARITILGPDDEVVERFGEGTKADREVAGWPNLISPAGEIVRPVLEPGVLRTPHGITSDAGGNVYVSEWLVGGRVIKLVPVTPL
jgi:hypothetical protein